MRKRQILIAGALALMLMGTACGNSNTKTVTIKTGTAKAQTTSTASTSSDSSKKEKVTSDGTINADALFTERDLDQDPDLSDATKYTLSDNKDITIKKAGTYLISGNASNVTITVEAGDDDKVQIVLDNADITNTDSPCIYVKTGDKVFITSKTGTDNSLKVTGEFTADGDTNTDAVIFSKQDLTLNGGGSLDISSTANGVSSKDDLTITGGTYKINAEKDAFEAHDSIAVKDGTFDLDCKNGLKAEDKDDTSTGFLAIEGGTFTINASNDCIHATTIAQIDGGNSDLTGVECIESTKVIINGGTLDISSSDDGINASQKSTSYDVSVNINGGDIKIKMGSGDTDGIDANGSIYVNGGTLDITANSPFDYDAEGKLNGGTVTVNGEEVTELENQFANGMGMGPGGQGGKAGSAPGNGGMPGGPGKK